MSLLDTNHQMIFEECRVEDDTTLKDSRECKITGVYLLFVTLGGPNLHVPASQHVLGNLVSTFPYFLNVYTDA